GPSAPDRVSRSKLVVDSGSQGVVVGNTAWVANEVSEWIGVIGDGIKVRQCGAHRVNPIRRNHVSRKGNFSKRINDGDWQATEVPGALLESPHQGRAGARLPPPRPFIGKHPK